MVHQWSINTPARMDCSRSPMEMEMAMAMMLAEMEYSAQRLRPR